MFNPSFNRHHFMNVAIQIQYLSQENLLPQKLFWNGKQKLFLKMKRERDQIKVAEEEEALWASGTLGE